MFQEKSPEAVCNASLIRNVWEIRTKTYTQKLNTEDERVKKSALQQINQEWQNRMESKRKAPPRLERKARHNENTTLQNYLNKPALSHMNNTDIFNSKFQNQRGSLSKRGKFINDIYQGQPSLQMWGKSWKFSRPKLHMEEEGQAESVSDWGESWKFLNLQPNLEDQPWSEQDLYDDDLDFQLHNGTTLLSKEAKSNAFLSSQDLEENLCCLEWEQSWKFPKHPSHEKESSSEEDQYNGSTDIESDEDMCLSYGSMPLDYENEMSEWSESWKVPKPEETDSQSVESEPMEDEDHEDNLDKTSVSKWFESWMILYHELPKKKSQSSDWSESWKLLHVPSQQEKNSHTDQGLSDESSDIHDFERMLPPKGNKINILLTSQDFSVSEWSGSWEITKPQVQALPQNDQRHESEKDESMKGMSESILDFQSEKESCVKIKSKYRQFLSPQVFCDELSTSEWGESWKYFKHQSFQDIHTDELFINQMDKKKSLSDWSESWKFSQKRLCNDKPSFTEWENSWFFTSEPYICKALLIQENRANDHLDLLPGNSTFLSKSVKFRNLLNSMLHKDRPSLSEWSDSWKITNLEISQQTEFEESLEIQNYNEMMFNFKAEKCRIFCASHTHEEKLSLEKWGESWKFAKRQHPRDGAILSKKCKIINFQNSEWASSWKFLNLTLHQKKECWEKSWTNVAEICRENPSKWGKPWKISNPQPPMENGSWLKAEDFHHQNQLIILAKSRCRKFLFSQLETNRQSLRLWSHSWKLLKRHADNKTKAGKSSSQDSSDLYTHIMSRRSKARKVLMTPLEKEKLAPRKWGDAWRLAKTQPRQRRGSYLKTSKETMKEDKAHLADWSKSWKFLYTQQTEEKSFMPEWEESWKYLLTHQQEREGERSK
ncbi:uncharacterized protein LOC118212405 [Anguilla anguilla]|uniref:uncharacterized protein LOC118212405 n=1 Tax=Anguilla anguilla TaxID=7936 RepID=UPI0015A88CF9|nr:uncharacterized protein LOC118212405 [Anguilla anguilla]